MNTRKKKILIVLIVIFILFFSLFKFSFSVFTSVGNVRITNVNDKYYVYIKEDNGSKTIKAECNKTIYYEIKAMDENNNCTFNIRGTNIITRFIPHHIYELESIEK